MSSKGRRSEWSTTKTQTDSDRRGEAMLFVLTDRQACWLTRSCRLARRRYAELKTQQLVVNVEVCFTMSFLGPFMMFTTRNQRTNPLQIPSLRSLTRGQQ